MKRPSFVLAALVAALAMPGAAQAAPKLSAEDKAWIEKCATRLSADEKKRKRSATVYCTCMHEQVEDNADMTQTQMERSWPPMHLYCRKQAGWK